MNDNKIIAEFMGYDTYESNGYNMVRYSDDNERTLQDTHYHTSWDWLMPVVEKCYHNGADENEVGDITHGLLDCDIDHTYKAVVEFINTYK